MRARVYLSKSVHTTRACGRVRTGHVYIDGVIF